MPTADVLAERLRALADHLERLHKTDPLPDLYADLSVQVTAKGAPEPARIAAVERINASLGMTSELEPARGHYGTRSILSLVGYAYTPAPLATARAALADGATS